MDTCIAIRMAAKKEGHGHRAGGRRYRGEVVPHNEDMESANKARAVMKRDRTRIGGVDG